MVVDQELGMKLLEAARPGRRRMISVKQQAKRMRRVGWTVALPADSQRRQVARALPNSDLRLQ
jgi:hypothetical protein